VWIYHLVADSVHPAPPSDRPFVLVKPPAGGLRRRMFSEYTGNLA